jgi:hypothetical protein
MQSGHPQLTPEQCQAIAANGGVPIQLEDPDTHKVYLLLEQSPGATLDDEFIREELSKGIAALEAGERRAWDPERIKQEGRRRLEARRASP